MSASRFICATILISLLVSCSPSEQQTGTHQTIAGAFGWVFGQKLPDQYSVSLDDTGVYSYAYDTNGLFSRITVGVDEQRTVCMIEGVGDAGSLGISDKETLVKTLSDKYGLSDHAASDIAQFGHVEGWTFGKGGSTIHLTIMRGSVTILYRFDPVLETLQQKFEQQKTRQFQTNIQGI